ncbi:helix-turn-helix domain-containing protein [Streptomyces orinoci]|uniref:Helix-turn-helix transcriptional regulator n=1 Tax=Streptomyces orinoci TaxID=67339 RepID=A0ABV3JSQ9_STRON
MGAELRKLREKAGLTGAELAARMGGERAQISHVESGRYGVSAERVRRWAAYCSATDKYLVDALAQMAEERTKGWWEEYRGVLSQQFLDIAELEHHAKYLWSIELLHIPGILQTEDYARELMSGSLTRLPARDVAARVEHRLRRREIFDRPAPARFDVFIHEAALRMLYCERVTMRAQLDFLTEVAEWPNVRVRVIPFETRLTSSIGSVLYAGGPVQQLDTVHLDQAFQGIFLDAQAQLAKYQALLHATERAALPPAESSKFIQRIAEEL